MNATLIDTIARHYPGKSLAASIITAIETCLGHAESQLDDLQSGVEQGLYEEEENRADINELAAAIDLLQGAE